VARTEYDRLLDEGRGIHGGLDAGRPGRGGGYWPLWVPAQALRLNYHVTVSGRHHVAPGPGILIGNHISMLDPVIAGFTSRWRLAFFTKIEAYRGPSGAFLRLVGQIPLKRGDEASTRWALAMAHEVLLQGRKLGIYPEGTRSADGRSLYRLHRRVLVPILEANPGVPVHAMAIRYGTRRRGRVPVRLSYSPALHLDPEAMSADALTETVTAAILRAGGMPYVPMFGQAAKRRPAGS
jgi:1-acyl-sn-glycerol-3-phosphate acyltransferase